MILLLFLISMFGSCKNVDNGKETDDSQPSSTKVSTTNIPSNDIISDTKDNEEERVALDETNDSNQSKKAQSDEEEDNIKSKKNINEQDQSEKSDDVQPSISNDETKKEDFFKLVDSGNFEEISVFLDNNPDFDVNTTFRTGYSALCYAVKTGNFALVDKLISQGGDVNFINKKFGINPLYLGVLSGKENIVRKLITSGADVNNNPSAIKFTPFGEAILSGKIASIDLLLNEPTLDINQINQDNGLSYLMVAAFKGDIKTVEKIIDKQTFKNELIFLSGKDKDNKVLPSPLMYCLLKSLSNKNSEIYQNMSNILLNKLKTDDINMQDSNEDNNTLIHKVVKLNSVTLFNIIMNKNPDLSITNDDEDSVSHIVVRNGYKDLTQKILDKIKELNKQKNLINISSQNKNGDTILHVALKKEKIDHEMVEILLEAGVIMNIKNKDQDNDGNDIYLTPLMIATQKGSLKVVKMILAKASKVPAVVKSTNLDSSNDQEKGYTIIHEASSKGYSKILQFLIEELHKSDVNKSSNTPKKGRIEIKRKTSDDNTALHLIAGSNKNKVHRNEYESIINILLEYGVDINDKNENDNTALEEAIISGRYDIAIYLGKKDNIDKVDRKWITELLNKKKLDVDSILNRLNDVIKN